MNLQTSRSNYVKHAYKESYMQKLIFSYTNKHKYDEYRPYELMEHYHPP